MGVFARYGVLSIGMQAKIFIGGGLPGLARSCKCDDSLAVVVEYETKEGNNL